MRFRRRARPSIKQAFDEALSKYVELLKSGGAHDKECASSHMMELAGAVAVLDKSPAGRLAREADECEDRCDWPAVETALLEELELYADSPGGRSMQHYKLASLYSKLCCDDDVLRHVALGAEAAQHAEVSSVRAMLLMGAAGYYLSQCDVKQAQPLVDEALVLLETETMFDSMLTRLTIMRAACLMFDSRLDEAEAQLATAKAMIDARPTLPSEAGVHRGRAEWWDGVSAVRQRRGDQVGAVVAFEKSLEIIRQIATIPHCAGVDMQWRIAIRLRKLAKLLEISGDPMRAAETSAEAKGILQAIRLWEYQKEKY